MKKVKVKSNSIRSRIHVLGDIQLNFDDQGVAEMPAHLVPKLAPYLRAKPGRFEVLVEEEKAAEPAKAEAPKAEAKSEEKSEDKSEKKEEKKAEESDAKKDESEESESKSSNKKSKKGSSSKKK